MQDQQFPESLPEESWESSRTNTAIPQDAASRVGTASRDAGIPELEANQTNESRLLLQWERLTKLGFADSILRVGTHMLSVSLVLLVVWVMREFYLRAQVTEPSRESAFAAPLPTNTATAEIPTVDYTAKDALTFRNGISRLAMMHTTIPTRPRTEIVKYTVQTGDTIFGIAEKFGIKPETVLWGNYYILADDPHNLTPGQELNILPLDGTYHKWSAGEGLNGVADGYGVTPDVIINWPGNKLSAETIGDLAQPNIEPGTMLLVPGGSRQFVTWSAPRITRANPGVAKVIGPGACGVITDGAVGIGTFIWPAPNQWLSGFDYSPATNHYGLDIDGDLGHPLFASDNGVVVYAGWNNFGYGYMVVVDHGNGWQTLYAHMSVIGVSCGQSVYQGSTIGQMGSTGNSSGPHLHYEMMHDSYGKVNPWDFLP